MKRFAIALALSLAACSGAGNPPPVPSPTPAPTPTPAAVCGQNADRVNHPLKFIVPTPKTIMRPRTAKSSPIGGPLKYGGGPVIVASKVYVVAWGMAVTDPAVQAYLTMLNAVGSSGWLGTTTQYCQSPDTFITNPPNLLGGTWSDTSDAIPPSATQNDIANEAQIAAAHFGVADPIDAQVQVVVMTPHGVVPQGFESEYCGWHANVGALSYTLLPYVADAGQGCGAQSDDKYAGVSIVGGHELAEAITDPEPSSGWTGKGGEIGDKCAWYDIQRVPLVGASPYLQPLWSNLANACVQ